MVGGDPISKRLHSPASKRPTWCMRRKIHAFFLCLMQYGAVSDMYIFCQSHVSLVRLALLEYFMHFTHEHMPIEGYMMPHLIDESFDRLRVYRLVTFIADQFRQNALQDTDPNQLIDWTAINMRAQQAIERCNRTCKAVPVIHSTSRSSSSASATRVPTAATVSTAAGPHLSHTQHSLSHSQQHHQHSNAFDAALISMALRLPQIRAFELPTVARQYDLHTLAQLFKIHRHIARFPLPIHMQQHQYHSLTHLIRQPHHVTAHATAFLHVCLSCHASNCEVSTRMRVSYGQAPVCHSCDSNQHVIAVNVLGSLVRIGTKYYYFCETANVSTCGHPTPLSSACAHNGHRPSHRRVAVYSAPASTAFPP